MIPWSCVWRSSGGIVGGMTIEFVRNGETLGSFAEEVVPSFVESGAIQQTDHFWHEGMADWQLVSIRWPHKAPPPIPKPLPVRASPQSNSSASSGSVACSQCGAKMERTTHAKKYMGLQLVGVFVGVIGIVLLFFFPLGTLLGIVLLLGAARLGYKKLKVWKCRSCDYFFERAA